jgi:hypothetical protein
MPHDEGESTTMNHDEGKLMTMCDGTVLGVSPPDEIQGYAGGSAQILLRSNMVVNEEVFVAARDAASIACVFDYTRPCNNVKNDQPKQSSLSLIGTFGSADENVSSSSSVVAVSSSPAKPARQYFKKRSRKLCRNLQRRQTCDRKRSSFDYEQYCHQTTNREESTPPVVRSLSNRGHSPTKEEVKMMTVKVLWDPMPDLGEKSSTSNQVLQPNKWKKKSEFGW